MKTTILILVLMSLSAMAKVYDEKTCAEKYYVLKNQLNSSKEKLVNDSYANVLYYATPVSGTLLAASDLNSISDASDLIEQVDTMIQLYNESLVGEGATFVKMAHSLVSKPNLEIMSSAIVDLYEQNIFCSDSCSRFRLNDSSTSESTYILASNFCLAEEAKHYILKEYVERISSLKVN